MPPTLDDIAASAEALAGRRVLQALARPRGPWPAELPGGDQGPTAQRVRRQARALPSAELRRSVRATLTLLATRPPIDRDGHHAARLRYRRLLALRAVEDDLAALGQPPHDPAAQQLWQRGALAVLRFRKDHHIHDPDRPLGEPATTSERLRRSEVELLVGQARQLITDHDLGIHLGPADPTLPDLHPEC